MRVKELVEALSLRDQNSNVSIETTLFLGKSRIVISSVISEIDGVAGGSLSSLDNRFYGVVIRSES